MIGRGGFLTLLLAALLTTGAGGAGAHAREIEAKDLRRHIDILASDAFGGRQPGTPGGELARSYIVEQWKRIGLKPAGANGGWEQPLTIIERRPLAQEVKFSRRGRPVKIASDAIVLTGTNPHDRIADARILFVGALSPKDSAIAPLVYDRVIVITPPAGLNADAAEDAVRAARAGFGKAGAAAVLVVVDDAGWPRLARENARPEHALQGDSGGHARIEGLVSESFMVALVTAAGGDWDILRRRAVQPGFTGSDLGISAVLETASEVTLIDSANVVARIPGRLPGSGAVMFMAHWDGLGECRPETATDRMCNGAVDNASGIALITEVARGLVRSKPERDIWFVATTGEEIGLLGAKAFIADPPLPLSSIVALFNVDTVAIAPAGASVALIGRGMGPLDRVVEDVARYKKRTIDSSTRANDFVRRQDGWPFMEAGVPTLMVNSSFSDRALLDRWMAERYHGPADQDDGTLELGAAVQDANLHVSLGAFFADTRKYVPPPKDEGAKP